MSNNKKLFNKFLCFGMSCLVASSSFIYEVSANSALKTDAVKMQNSENKKKSEPGVLKSFLDNHPDLTICIVALGAYAVGKMDDGRWYEIGKLGYDTVRYNWNERQALREFDASKIPTAIDGLSDEEINNQIAEEVEKYKGREPRVFKIEDKLITESDKRLFLLTIKQLNYLFDKYSGFTERLIYYKLNKAEDHEFVLKRISFMRDGFRTYMQSLQYSDVKLNGFGIGNLSDYKSCFYRLINSTYTHWLAPHSDDKLVESVITHEFGHAMQFLYLIDCGCQLSRGIRESWANKIALEIINRNYFKSGDMCDKNEVCGVKIIDDFKDFSRYGSTSAVEFFAELFSAYECLPKEKASDIVKNTEAFIVERMHFLEPKNSKFCQGLVV